MVRYGTVLLDADNTLFDFSRSEREAVADALGDFGFSCDDGIIDEYSKINRSLWEMLERGEIAKDRLRDERFEILFASRGFDLRCAKAVADAYTLHLSQKAYLIDGAEELVREVSRDADLYIITNGIKGVQTPRFEASGLKRYFKGVFISEEVGFEKPDVRYFEAVARDIPNFCPERTLVVGDSLTSDIRGGINAGIDTCWFNPSGKSAIGGMNITYIVGKLSEIVNIIRGGSNRG